MMAYGGGVGNGSFANAELVIKFLLSFHLNFPCQFESYFIYVCKLNHYIGIILLYNKCN